MTKNGCGPSPAVPLRDLGDPGMLQTAEDHGLRTRSAQNLRPGHVWRMSSRRSAADSPAPQRRPPPAAAPEAPAACGPHACRRNRGPLAPARGSVGFESRRLCVAAVTSRMIYSTTVPPQARTRSACTSTGRCCCGVLAPRAMIASRMSGPLRAFPPTSPPSRTAGKRTSSFAHRQFWVTSPVRSTGRGTNRSSNASSSTPKPPATSSTRGIRRRVRPPRQPNSRDLKWTARRGAAADSTNSTRPCGAARRVGCTVAGVRRPHAVHAGRTHESPAGDC